MNSINEDENNIEKLQEKNKNKKNALKKIIEGLDNSNKIKPNKK